MMAESEPYLVGWAGYKLFKCITDVSRKEHTAKFATISIQSLQLCFVIDRYFC